MKNSGIILTVCFIVFCLGFASEYSKNITLEAKVHKLKVEIDSDVVKEQDDLQQIQHYIDGLTNQIGELNSKLGRSQLDLNDSQQKADKLQIELTETGRRLADVAGELKKWKDAWKKLPGE